MTPAGSYDLASFAIDSATEVRRLKAQLDLFWRQELPLFTSLGLSDGMKVLDCGCGPGYLLQKVGRLYPSCQCTGVDVDPLLVNIALETTRQEGLSNCSFYRQSALELEFEERSFDFVIMRLLLEHLPTPEKALNEVLRVLREGGTAVFIDNDFDFHERTWPDCPALDDLYEAYRRARREDGGNPCIGRQLPYLLKKAGYTSVGLNVLAAHSELVGDEAFLKASGAGIPAQLVKTGHLEADSLQTITEQWAAMLSKGGHAIFRMLMAASGKKPQEPSVLKELSTAATKGNGNGRPLCPQQTPEVQPDEIQRLIRQILETEMEMPPDTLALDEPLIAAGVDSLAALRLCNRLNTDFAVTLKIADVISGKTIEELATDVMNRLRKKQSASESGIHIQPRNGRSSL